MEVKIIADSVSPQEIRLTTFQLRYPRFIHAELMTHRVFSRNARSSRAVPVKTLMAEDPYIPHFKKNQPGMQAMEEMSAAEQYKALCLWRDLIASTRDGVEKLMEMGVHKQWANRPLEWFGYIDVLVTSVYWKNWYELRDHPAAMPEIQQLAGLMAQAQADSTPNYLEPGQWHLPYIEEPPLLGDDAARCRISAARCARLSYKPFDSETADPGKDYELFNKLLVEQPVHASPAEHQATPDEWKAGWSRWLKPELHGNLTGWVQFRKTLANEAYMEDYRR